jgi:hypothetical protein
VLVVLVVLVFVVVMLPRQGTDRSGRLDPSFAHGVVWLRY